MPWFKIDDGFHCHPKALAAGNAAIGLWSRLGSYSSDQLTDGFIPAAIAKGYGTKTEITRLINVRLIEPGDHELYGPGYWLHDFLDYNPTANKVRDDRAAAAERQRKSRTMSQRDNGNGHGVSHTTPSRPVPSRPDTSQLPTTSSVLRAVPEQADDDDFQRVIELITQAKIAEYKPTNPRAYRTTVIKNTTTEDGELIKALLTDGLEPEHVALFVLGHAERQGNHPDPPTPWCQPDCPNCDGDSWIHTDAGLTPCPHRHAS